MFGLKDDNKFVYSNEDANDAHELSETKNQDLFLPIPEDQSHWKRIDDVGTKDTVVLIDDLINKNKKLKKNVPTKR